MTTRRGRQIAAIGGLALGAALLLAGQLWLMSHLSWTHRQDPSPSLIGINFSCDHAEYLLLEEPGGAFIDDERPGRAEWCADTLARLLRETGARSVRLSAQWDEVQPAADQFDFSTLDALITVAGFNGATVNLSVGMKAQRHPEFYIPEWALRGTSLEDGDVISEDPVLRERVLEYIRAVVTHFGGEPVVDSWGAENEPYIASHRSDRYSLSRGYVAEVVATIRETDPLARAITINHAQHFVMDRRWKDALADSDVLAQSMYPRRNVSVFGIEGVVNIMELGPLMPNYAHQARESRAAGKQFWVTELQGEPWTDGDARLISPANPSSNLSPKTFAENVTYARRSGAERIYLWGSEWWLYQADRFDDSRWLETAAREIAAAR